MKKILVLIILLASLAVLSVASFGAVRSDVADAAMKGDKAAVRTLIQQKADVNAPQPDGATALHWAAYRGDKELVDLLIKAGFQAHLYRHLTFQPASESDVRIMAVGRKP